MSEDAKAHIRTYLIIGGSLLVLTVLTVAVAEIEFSVWLGVVVALIIATFKGSLVVSFFMHLIEEKKMIFAALLLTVVFFIALIFLPLLGHADKHGEYYTIPNANAPAAAPAAGH